MFHQHPEWEMARFATDLNFMQEVRENLGEFSPFLILLYQKYIDCIHFQASHYKAKSLMLHPLLQAHPPSTPQPQKSENTTELLPEKWCEWDIFSM